METNLREAKRVSEPTTPTLYCIRDERMVKAEQGELGWKHPEGDWKEEVEFCLFPDGWAVCPPPDLPEGWECQDAPEEEREEAEIGNTLWTFNLDTDDEGCWEGE